MRGYLSSQYTKYSAGIHIWYAIYSNYLFIPYILLKVVYSQIPCRAKENQSKSRRGEVIQDEEAVTHGNSRKKISK